MGKAGPAQHRAVVAALGYFFWNERLLEGPAVVREHHVAACHAHTPRGPVPVRELPEAEREWEGVGGVPGDVDNPKVTRNERIGPRDRLLAQAHDVTAARIGILLEVTLGADHLLEHEDIAPVQ